MRATGEGQSACTGAEAPKTDGPAEENATGPQLHGACTLVCLCDNVCVWGGLDLRAITSTAGFKGSKVFATKCRALTRACPPVCLTLSPHACGDTCSCHTCLCLWMPHIVFTHSHACGACGDAECASYAHVCAGARAGKARHLSKPRAATERRRRSWRSGSRHGACFQRGRRSSRTRYAGICARESVTCTFPGPPWPRRKPITCAVARVPCPFTAATPCTDGYGPCTTFGKVFSSICMPLSAICKCIVYTYICSWPLYRHVLVACRIATLIPQPSKYETGRRCVHLFFHVTWVTLSHLRHTLGTH